VAVAVRQRVKYVTILIGANDVCTNAITAMTPVGTFAQTFRSDLATLFKGLPAGAHVSVYSIPNLFRLWQLFNGNRSAEYAWSIGTICQSMLSSANTAAERTTVLNREEAFNSAMATACKKYPACRWDDLAVFNEKFTAASVSVDYFHPSVRGQAQLAQTTWAASWWPTSK
jgi:lysophospholipase L1-like esterase